MTSYVKCINSNKDERDLTLTVILCSSQQIHNNVVSTRPTLNSFSFTEELTLVILLLKAAMNVKKQREGKTKNPYTYQFARVASVSPRLLSTS